METKTKDNVFVTIPISVQNRVRPEKAYDAYYKLADPAQQISFRLAGNSQLKSKNPTK